MEVSNDSKSDQKMACDSVTRNFPILHQASPYRVNKLFEVPVVEQEMRNLDSLRNISLEQPATLQILPIPATNT